MSAKIRHVEADPASLGHRGTLAVVNKTVENRLRYENLLAMARLGTSLHSFSLKETKLGLSSASISAPAAWPYESAMTPTVYLSQ